MNKISSTRLITIAEYLFYSAIVIFIFLKGTISTGDTGAYFNYHFNRTPLVPVIFNLARAISPLHYKSVILLFHIGLGIISIRCFLLFIHRYYALNRLTGFIISLFIISPYIIGSNFANVLVSEGVSYPLFILVIINFTESIYKPKLIYFIRFFIFLSLLILARGQYVYMYIVFLIFLTLLITRKRISGRLFVYAVLIMLSSYAFNNLAVRTYNFYLGRGFISSTFNWWLLTPSFFISERDDKSHFTNPEDALFFTRVNDLLVQRGLTAESFQEAHPNLNSAKLYGREGLRIYNIIDSVFRTTYANGKYVLYDKGYSDIKNVNSIYNKIAYNLITHNKKAFVTFWIKYFFEWLGGYSWGILIFAILISIVNIISRTQFDDFGLIFLAVVVTTLLFNSFLLALFANFESRYIKMNYVFLITSIFISVNHFLKNLKFK